MNHMVLTLAYFGPETVLPVTSLVATVAGIFMIMGRHTIRFALRLGWAIVTYPRRLLGSGKRGYAGPHAQRGRQHDGLTGQALAEQASSIEP
ncbi:MAG: hypothetical protein U0790_09925 [Isosphaeraceae bacterium]